MSDWDKISDVSTGFREITSPVDELTLLVIELKAVCSSFEKIHTVTEHKFENLNGRYTRVLRLLFRRGESKRKKVCFTINVTNEYCIRSSLLGLLYNRKHIAYQAMVHSDRVKIKEFVDKIEKNA